MIGTFITSEGEGLNNQYQSMKLREAKVEEVMDKMVRWRWIY